MTTKTRKLCSIYVDYKIGEEVIHWINKYDVKGVTWTAPNNNAQIEFAGSYDQIKRVKAFVDGYKACLSV